VGPKVSGRTKPGTASAKYGCGAQIMDDVLLPA